MKIGVFEVEKWEEQFLKEAFPKATFYFSKSPLSLRNVSKYKQIDTAVVFIHSKITSTILDRLPKLRLITTQSTGYDHIDLGACKRRKITVCNVPAYGARTVAEHTFALLLALSKKLVESVERTRKGSFSLAGLRGFDLQGKKLGVIGTGRIGQEVIKIAKGFEMKVIAYDKYKSKGIKYVSLNRLLKEADIVTLHVPYLKETHHLLDKKAFSLMKKGAYLLNTSRGGVVDTSALVWALKNGRLAGAGLDVLEEECALEEETQLLKGHFLKQCDLSTVVLDHQLLKMKNVLITPHNAFNTKEALWRIAEVTVRNVKGKGNRVS